MYVKVVDFGIAKFLQEAEDTIGKITKTGTVCGSPTYMSPEQCDDGTVDHRSDIYSLGVVFYESITGKVPFSGTDIYHVMTMHVKEPPPRLRFTRPDLDFPAHMEQVIEKVLAKDPDARYQSVDDLWEALKGRPGDRTRSPGTQIPAPRTGELPALTGAAGKSVSEAEVAGVVSKALQKRMSGNPDLLAGQPPVPSAQPAVASATEEGGRIPTSALAVVSNRTSPEPSRMRAGVSLLDRVVGTWQAAAPALLTILLSAALLWVVANETLIHSLIDQNIKPMFAHTKTPPDAQSPESLIEKGKLEQARAILEKHKKGGHLSPAEADLLDTVYVRLARKEAQQKHFKNAVSLLEKVGGDASGSDEVKSLLKKYRKAAGR